MNAPCSHAVLTAEQEQLIGEVSACLEQGSSSMVEAGKRLCMLKSVVPHGQFIKVLAEQLGLSRSYACKRMDVARKLEGIESHQVLLDLPRSKLMELVRLDQDEIEAIVLGGEVSGLSLDSIRLMMVRELRAAISRYLPAKPLPDCTRASASAPITRRKTYGMELCKTLMRYADELEADQVVAELEELVRSVSERRHVPGLVAARYDVFRKFWLNGEVCHG